MNHAHQFRYDASEGEPTCATCGSKIESSERCASCNGPATILGRVRCPICEYVFCSDACSYAFHHELDSEIARHLEEGVR